MKNYLLIKSKGEIEENALILLGASTKRNDETKIGYFGSGLKYSISSLIRNNIGFKIFSGLNEININQKQTEFRDFKFNKLIINGVETGMTDQMGGKDWDNFFAPFREIYSNALDEDNNTIFIKTDSVLPEKGFTSFFIEINNSTQLLYDNFDKYFCIKRNDVIYSNNYASAYPSFNHELILYRKGIQVKYDEKIKSIFNYNSSHFDLNEARTLSDDWTALYYVSKSWVLCENIDAINTLLLSLNGGNTGYYEHSLIWDCYESFSMQWLEVIRNKKFVAIEHLDLFEENEINNRYKLQFDLLKKLKHQFGDEIDILGLETKNQSEAFIDVKPSVLLIDKVLDAISLLRKSNYKERIESPKIRYVKFNKSSILGQAINGTILLSYKLELKSIEDIAKIIIEENEHLISDYNDMTREFQSHLFDLYYNELMKSV